jgi:hypothetical protein
MNELFGLFFQQSKLISIMKTRRNREKSTIFVVKSCELWESNVLN